MTLRSVPPNTVADAFLRSFREGGGVLQTSFFVYDEGDEAQGVASLSRLALDLRFEEMLAENARFRAALPPGTPCWELTRTPGKAPEATPTTLREILGDTFDPRTGELRMFRFGADYEARSSEDHEGLPRALLNPPYGVRVPGAREWPKSAAEEPAYHAAYREVLRAYVEDVLGVSLLGHDTTPPVCFRWSTDWSTFFDAGREWWGTFCWTLLRPRDRTVIVLLASSTD